MGARALSALLCISLTDLSWATTARVAPLEAPGGTSPAAGVWVSLADDPAQLQPSGLFTQLGVSDPGQALVLSGVLDRLSSSEPGLSPESLLRLDTPAQRAEAVRSALGRYAEDLVERSQHWEGFGLDALKADQDAELGRLEDFDAALRELRPILSLLPRKQGLLVLDRSREIAGLLGEKRFERAAWRVQELKAAWGLEAPRASQAPRSPEDWAEFYGLVDGSLPEEDFKDRADAVLLLRQEAFRAAAESPNLSILQRPLARLLIGRREKENQLRRWMIAQARAPEDLGRATDGERGLLAALRAYAPGLRPERVAIADEGLVEYHDDGSGPAGWATRNGDSLVATAPGLRRLGLIEVALHEGFHQGDDGYRRASQALRLLLGRQAGSALEKVLIEGYTQHRTQEAMLRMLRLGYEGKAGVERDLVGLSERAFGTAGRDATEAALNGDFASPRRSYAPFVSLARSLLRNGGQEALEALVSRGDVSILIGALGPGRWTLLARLAALYGRYSDREDKTLSHLGRASGLSSWLVSKMEEVVDGRTSSAQGVQRIEEIAEGFRSAAVKALAGFSPGRRFELLDALKGFDFEGTRDAGAEIERRLRVFQPEDGLVDRLQRALLAASLALVTVTGLFALQPGGEAWGIGLGLVGGAQLALSLLLLHLWPVWAAARGSMKYMLRFLPREAAPRA